MYKINITVLSETEHQNWRHSCGVIGDENMTECDKCPTIKKEECLTNHCIQIDGDPGNTFGQILHAMAFQMMDKEKTTAGRVIRIIENITEHGE